MAKLLLVLVPKRCAGGKAIPGDSDHARTALDFIRELYLIEHTLWDREHPVTPARRREVRSMRSAPIMARFHAWLEALSSQVLPESPGGREPALPHLTTVEDNEAMLPWCVKPSLAPIAQHADVRQNAVT